MPQKRAAEVAAAIAVARRIERLVALRVARVLDPYFPLGSERQPVSAIARRQRAIEEVDAVRDREQNVRGRAHAHQIARPIGWHLRRREDDAAVRFFDRLSDAKT